MRRDKTHQVLSWHAWSNLSKQLNVSITAVQFRPGKQHENGQSYGVHFERKLLFNAEDTGTGIVDQLRCQGLR